MLPQILPFVMLFGGAGKGVLGNLEFNLGLIYGCGSVMWLRRRVSECNVEI